MRPAVGGTMLALPFVVIWCAAASGDGGSMRLSAIKSGYRITVFTAPVPFRAGLVDISTLVQDASTGEPMTQARVTVRMTSPGRLALECPATTEAATNKLFRAAKFELPEPGRWEIQVQVDGSHGQAELGCEVEAAKPLARLPQMWLWIGWPAVVVALFGVHEWRRTRRASRTDRQVQNEGGWLHSRSREAEDQE
jgi:hypothetical protein